MTDGMAENLIVSKASRDSDTAQGCLQPSPMTSISVVLSFRDRQLLGALVELLVSKDPGSQ